LRWPLVAERDSLSDLGFFFSSLFRLAFSLSADVFAPDAVGKVVPCGLRSLLIVS